MKLYTGHDAYHGWDYLLTVHDDGTLQIATRPTSLDGARSWSSPVDLHPHTSEVSA